MVVSVVGSAARAGAAAGSGGGRVCGAVAALLALPALAHSLPRHTLLNIQDVSIITYIYLFIKELDWP